MKACLLFILLLIFALPVWCADEFKMNPHTGKLDNVGPFKNWSTMVRNASSGSGHTIQDAAGNNLPARTVFRCMSGAKCADAGGQTRLTVPSSSRSSSGLQTVASVRLSPSDNTPGMDTNAADHTNIVILGDSISWGRKQVSTDQSTYGLDVKPAASWPALWPNTTFTISGEPVNGNTTTDQLAYIQSMALDHDSNLFTICFGWNDSSSTVNAIPVSQFEANYRAIIEAILLWDNLTGYNRGKAKIILMTEPPAWEAGPDHTSIMPTYTNASKAPFDAVTRRLANEYELELIDLDSTIPANSTYVGADGIHLTDAGYSLMYDTVTAKAQTILDVNGLLPKDRPSRWYVSADRTNGRIGIGHYPTVGTLETSKSGGHNFTVNYVYGADSGYANYFVGRSAGGTRATPSVMPADQPMFKITAGGAVSVTGSTPTWSTTAASIELQSAGLFSATSIPSRIALYTTPSGSTTLAKRMTLEPSGEARIMGSLKVGADSAPTEVLDVTGNIKSSGYLYGDATYLTNLPASGLQYQATTANGNLLLYYTPDGKAHNSFATDDGSGNISIPSGKTYNINGSPHTHNYQSPITASDKQAIYSNGANSPTGSSSVFMNDASGDIHVSHTDSTSPILDLESTNGQGGRLSVHIKGPSGAAVTDGTATLNIFPYVWDGSAHQLTSAIQFRTDGLQSGTNRGSHIRFYTTDINSTSLGERLRINPNGIIMTGPKPTTWTSTNWNRKSGWVDGARLTAFRCISTALPIGTVVQTHTNSFGIKASVANSGTPIGAVYANVSGAVACSPGKYCWVADSGISNVLLKNSTACNPSQIVITSDTAGRALCSTAPDAAVTHWQEMGHPLDTTAGGTDVLMPVTLHFNSIGVYGIGFWQIRRRREYWAKVLKNEMPI